MSEPSEALRSNPRPALSMPPPAAAVMFVWSKGVGTVRKGMVTITADLPPKRPPKPGSWYWKKKEEPLTKGKRVRMALPQVHSAPPWLLEWVGLVTANWCLRKCYLTCQMESNIQRHIHSSCSVQLLVHMRHWTSDQGNSREPLPLKLKRPEEKGCPTHRSLRLGEFVLFLEALEVRRARNRRGSNPTTMR